MSTPINWFRRKFHGSVEKHVQAALIGTNQQISKLLEEIACRALDSRVDNLANATSVHLEAVDQLSQATNAIALDLAKRLDFLDNKSIDNALKLDDLISRLEALNLEFKVLSSRVRANPFSVEVNRVASSRDSYKTLGFASEGSGRYADFANVFRPEFSKLVEQLGYLKTWLPKEGVAVDLGAGRGEMVQVMLEHGLNAFGIDIDSSMVDEAMSRGLDVRLSSADDFFRTSDSESLAAVTAIQVVEHVDTPMLERWFAEAKRVLKPGGVFIAETPNPHAIDAFKAFWVDVTHVRPYYPESLLHMAQSAGFTRAEIWVEGNQESVYDRLGIAGSYAIIATA